MLVEGSIRRELLLLLRVLVKLLVPIVKLGSSVSSPTWRGYYVLESVTGLEFVHEWMVMLGTVLKQYKSSAVQFWSPVSH